MRIILTGASGLIGSRFEELMVESHEIIPLSSKNTDIVDDASVLNFFENHTGDVIIHFAAKTDVDGCEEDKEDDLNRISHAIGKLSNEEIMDLETSQWFVNGDEKAKLSAFAINFIGTRNLYREAKKRGIKFVYVSTDFVFKGEGEYDENSIPDPINWYGMTKWYGERLIDSSHDLIVRLSFPYGFKSPVKPDFVQKITSLLRDREEVALIEDQTITPTFIDDIVHGLDFLLKHDAKGIYHLAGGSYVTPHQIGLMLKEEFGFGTKITTAKREDIYNGKAKRPFQSIMKNDKLMHLGFTPKTFEEGLNLIKNS